jgi:modulator of FtsH protease
MSSAALDPAWAPFFETAAEASAGLVGLVIVAVSVNIRPILDQPHLPSRAGATIGALVLIMIGSLSALIPQSLGAWGGEMLGFALVIWLQHVMTARLILRTHRQAPRPLRELVAAIGLGQVQMIPYLIGSAMALSGGATGVYWVVGGMLGTLALSVFSAWVLLVEILR